MTIKEAFESLAKVTSKGMKNPFFVMRGLNKAFNDIASTVEGGGMPNYTASEQVTGTWLGKPRYQKTIILRENSVDKFTKSGNTYVDSLPANIAYVNLIQMYSLRQGNWVDCMNLKDQLSLCFDMTNRGVYVEAPQFTISDIFVTIEYTKTTD